MAPPTFVRAGRAHKVPLVPEVELESGQCRPLPDEGEKNYIKNRGCGYQYMTRTVKVLITAPKNLILIFSWRFYWSQKILLKSLVALKLGWRLVNRTLHTKAQRFLFSKRHFKKFSTAIGAINRAQQSSLTSKWRLN